MKILLIHNDYQQPGGEKVAFNALHSLLAQFGHTVILYVRDNKELADYRLKQKIAFFPNTIYSYQSVREIKRLIAREKPDLAHIHNVFPLISPAVYRALHFAGIPIVQTVHNFRMMCPNGLFYTRGAICERCKMGNTIHAVRYSCYRGSTILSLLYALSIGLHRQGKTFQLIDRFIALTGFTAHKLIESGIASENKISILGNFLQGKLPIIEDAHQEETYVLYVGRLSAEKGAEVAIRAMEGLPQLRLKILGSGPELPNLQRIIKELNLNNVDFLGHVEGNEKWKLWKNALATVIPSVCYETFSLVTLESMALGIPIIASDLGSLPFVVEDKKTGALFKYADHHDLREKLESLISDKYEWAAMGRAGRVTLEERYTPDAHHDQLMKIYQETLAKPPR